VNFQAYKEAIREIFFGKKLPDALYLYWEEKDDSLPPVLRDFLPDISDSAAIQSAKPQSPSTSQQAESGDSITGIQKTRPSSTEKKPCCCLEICIMRIRGSGRAWMKKRDLFRIDHRFLW